MASDRVDLYDNAYGYYASEAYREIRLETYGHDLGQTSWVTQEESSEIPRVLALTKTSRVLEVGCGSGRYALQVAETVGCDITGIDINEAGVRNATELAVSQGLSARARFQVCDASQPLSFPAAHFDAVFSNDVLCHVPERRALLRELFRVLEPGGRLLFSDALVIGGLISHQEIASRSSIGYYLFSPPGQNEQLLHEAGYSVLQVTDTTANAALISERWRAARAKRRDALIAVEGSTGFEGLQRFLECVAALTSERRLLRYVYLAQKPAR